MTRAGWHTRSGAVVIGNASAMRAHNNAIAARLREAQSAFDNDKLASAQAIAQRVLKREPGNTRAHMIVAVCAQRRGDLALAEQHFRRALNGDTQAADAVYGLAVVLCDQRRHLHALPFIEQALAIDENEARYHFRAGIILGGLGRGEESRLALVRSIELDPAQSLSRNALANYLRERGELIGALEHYRAATVVDPLEPSSYGNAAVSFQELGDIHASVRMGRACLALNPFNRVFFSNLLLALNYAHDLPKHALASMHRQYGALMRHVGPSGHAGRWIRREQLRVGLMSPDLRQHPIAAFVEPLLEYADAADLDVVCYSDSFTVDEVTRRLGAHPVRWRQIAGLDDELVARIIGSDELDVLLDLSGHTGANRLTLFNERLAPLQGTWLGYTFSTGIDGMDVRLTDPVADPTGLDDELYQERLLRLEAPFLSFQPPAITPAYGVRRPGPPRFICLNNVAKMSEPLLRAWAQILERVPESTLTMKSRLFADTQTTQYIRDRFTQYGIDARRLRTDPTLTSFEAHLRYYDAADIALDTFPYNGTTTTCEALWMGIPLVALRGDLHAGRVSASLLSCAGLADTLLTHCVEDYVERAVALASDVDATWAMRADIASRVRASKLVDATDFLSRLKVALHSGLEERRQDNSASAPSLPRYCFICGMPRSGSTWVFNVVRDMFAMTGQVVSLGFLEESDVVAVQPGHEQALHLAKLHRPNASVVRLLESGQGVAIVTERELSDVLASLAQFQDKSVESVCRADYIDPVIQARQYWRAQANTRRVHFDAITSHPTDVIRQLRHWLGLEFSDDKIDLLAERWSAEAVRERLREMPRALYSNHPFDPGTLLHPHHLRGSAVKDYRTVLGAQVHGAITAAATARENAHAELVAFAQALPAIPVRIGPERTGTYVADVWMQVSPDVREASTFITLEQGDWFEPEIHFMRRYLERGMSMLDVGANHGVYALSAAQAVGETGRVFAVEPGVESAARLLRASLLPGGAPLEVIRSALGGVDSHGQLANEGRSELRRLAATGEGDTVEIWRLDTLARTRSLADLDFIKLDVEGAEADVIAGAQALLDESNPLVQFEIRAGAAQTLDAMFALQTLGYDSYQVVPGLNVLRPFRRDADSYCLNLVAMKDARASELKARGLLFDDRQTPRLEHGTHSWTQMFSLWPYAASVQTSWCSHVDQAPAEVAELLAGIGWYLEAHAAAVTPAHAYRALERAAECFRLVCDAHPLQRLSLATVLCELGMRERAIVTLRPVVAALPDLPDPRVQPFICPLGEYRHVPIGRDVSAAHWMDALVRATFVRISSHSAMYLAQQAYILLGGAADPNALDARSTRTLTLLRALDAASEPGPMINSWQPEVVRAFDNLPGWLVSQR